MKKTDFKKVLIPVCIFGVFLLLPYFLNIIVILIESKMEVQHITGLDFDLWYDVLAIAFPSALTYLVLRQSEQQQEENERMQVRMEQLNEKMLQTELKSKIGYFLPKIDDQTKDGRCIPHRHDLRDIISFVHTGDDIIFVIEASYFFKGEKRKLPQNKPVCFVDKPSLNCYGTELGLSEEDLAASQINIDFEFILKNSKGYCYKQIINLGFENDMGIGIINEFNMDIQEVPADAD